MGLCPSNMIAAEENPGKRMFPNLARRVPENGNVLIFDEVDARCLSELSEAGIKGEGIELFRKCGNGTYSEVPTKYVGSLCCWGFRRAWYYWTAEGPGIPPDKAEEFHAKWGQQVRVKGHCGCPSPLEYCHGFAVDSYHIDTQDGLNAFAELLRSIYVEAGIASPE